MPALGSSNKSARVERILRRKRKARHPSRPAPVHQPGPFTDAERRKVEHNRSTPGYQKAIQKARVHGPGGRRGKSPAGDDHDQGKVKRAERHKQTVGYIHLLQSIRKKRGDTIGKGRYLDPKQLGDKNFYATFDRVKDAPKQSQKAANAERDRRLEAQHRLRSTAEKMGAKPEILKKIDQGTERLKRGELPQPKKKEQFPAQPDRPRTDAEYRKFLKGGKRPRARFHPKPTGGAGQGVASSGAEILKQSARGLHANAEVLTGGNFVHGFLHGHKTGSDVLKKLGVKNKVVRAVGGLALDIPLSGGGAKLTLRSPASKLEQAAGRAAVRGKAAKAAKLRAKAQKADTNRGFGAGFTMRVPFSHRGGEFVVGERATAKVAKHLHVPQGARRLHDTRPARAVGETVMPNYRHPTVPEAKHQTHRRLKLRKEAKDRDATRHAVRRGHAYNEQINHTHIGRRSKHDTGSEEQFLEGVERRPHEPSRNVKFTRHKTTEARQVKSLERKVFKAEKTLQRERGKSEMAKKARFQADGYLDALRSQLKRMEPHDPRRREVEAQLEASALELEGLRHIEGRRADLGKTGTGLRLRKEIQAAEERFWTTHDKYNRALQHYNGLENLKRQGGAAGRLGKFMDDGRKALGPLRDDRDAALRELKKLDNRLPPSARQVGAEANVEFLKTELQDAKLAARGKSKTERILTDTDRQRAVRDILADPATTRKSIADIKDPKVREAAQQWVREREQLLKEQQKAGIVDEGLPDYFHHRELPPDTKSGIPFLRRGKGGRAANPAHARRREDPRDVLTKIEGGANFDTNPGRVIAHYTANAKRALNDAEYLKGLKTEVGDKFTGQPIKDTQDVFEITPKGIKRADKQMKAIALKAENGEHDLVVLPKKIGYDEIKGRAPGDTRLHTVTGQWWDRMTAGWKTLVTNWNVPFYQERNLYDDTLRFWMGDGDPASYAHAVRLVTQLARKERGEFSVIPGKTKGIPGMTGTVKIGKQRIPAEDFIRQAVEDRAVRGGHHLGELHEMAHAGHELMKREHGAGDLLRKMAGNLEDVPRLATYLAALRRGMSRADAAAWTRLHHFDYADLTNSEKAIRRLIPFYTFSSRNVALQTRKALTRPGKYAILEAVREEAAKLAGLPSNWEDGLGETQKRALPIPIRAGNKIKLVYTGMSITDLNRIPLPGVQKPGEITKQQYDLFLQMVHPIPKGFAEMLGNHSFFFRSSIYRDAQNPEAPRWVPAPDWPVPDAVKKTLGYRKILDPKTGKMIDGWPAQVDYVVRSIGPQLGFVATLATPVKNSRGQSAHDRLVGQFSGVRLLDYDTTKGEGDQLRVRIGNIEAEMNDLRDLNKRKDGPIFPTKHYQALRDEKKRLQERYDTITQKRPTEDLPSRPLTPAEEARKKLEDILKGNPADKARRELQRVIEKQRIIGEGG